MGKIKSTSLAINLVAYIFRIYQYFTFFKSLTNILVFNMFFSEHQPVDLTIQTWPRTDHVLEGYDPAAKDEMENNNTFP